MFYAYLLLSQKDKKFYIGYTEDVSRRVQDHNEGKVNSTAYRRPLDLIYYEAYFEQRDAQGREKFLKSGSGHRYIKHQLKYFLAERYEGLVKPG